MNIIVLKIKKIMNNIQDKYKKNNLCIVNFDPLEAVIQYYMIELFTKKKYIDTTPSIIYNIFDSYNKYEDTKIKNLLEESKNIKDIIDNLFNHILNEFY